MTELSFILERVPTPLGQMLVVTDAQGRLRALDWNDYEQRMHLLVDRQYRGATVRWHEAASPSRATGALLAYFEGCIACIDELEVATGGTPFQQQVWSRLRAIAPGRTLSYRELAAAIGRPAAVRAVGAANGANPVGIVLPCHRVIGSNQALTGYAGGLERKQWLLDHERRWQAL